MNRIFKVIFGLFIYFTFIFIGNIGSEEKVSKEAVHRIDDLLLKRMFIVKKKIKEDKFFSNQPQYNLNYKDEIQRSEAFIDYFKKRLEIAKSIKDEINAGYKELEILSLKYTEGKPGYQLINTFKNWFYGYKRFVEAAYNDLDDKKMASLMYKIIVQLEMTQKNFFYVLEKSNIQQAKKFLDKENELIKKYSQNINKIYFKNRIPDKWKKEFVDTYTQMHMWNKKYFDAKKQNNEELYNKLILEGDKVLTSIPFIKSSIFMNELEGIIFDIPIELEILNKKSAELAMKAYELYFIQKYKIGEEPIKF